MEPITECEIDLFAGNLPSMEEIKKLSEFVRSSEANLIAFREQVEENMSKSGRKASLAAGIGLFILGRDGEAVKKLQKAKDCKEKFIYLALHFAEWENLMKQSKTCKIVSITRPRC